MYNINRSMYFYVFVDSSRLNDKDQFRMEVADNLDYHICYLANKLFSVDKIVGRR